MKSTNINHAFLDGVVAGTYPDAYYHFGVSSEDPIMDSLRDVRAIVMCGSGDRTKTFAQRWSRTNGDADIVAFAKEDRFVTRFTAGILFASHGMGMPSASIAVQEAMRMLYFLKDGDLTALAKVFWARVGTSGGIGIPGGTVVVSEEGVMADLQPYRVLRGADGYTWFDGNFPEATRKAIIAANVGTSVPIVSGKTVAGNEFFLEQFRLDGAISTETPESKQAWLTWLLANGVRNIEMEGAMFAGYLNHWGFPNFAMVCAALLDRLQGDQITDSAQVLDRYSEDAGDVLFRYLQSTSDTGGLPAQKDSEIG
jgi:uridine phosphorylase